MVDFSNTLMSLICQASYGEDEDSNDEDAEGNEYPEEVSIYNWFVVMTIMTKMPKEINTLNMWAFMADS